MARFKGLTRTKEAMESIYQTLVGLSQAGIPRATKAVHGEFLKVEAEVQLTCPVLITYGEFDQVGYVTKY